MASALPAASRSGKIEDETRQVEERLNFVNSRTEGTEGN
jgi:hypothetical protein